MFNNMTNNQNRYKAEQIALLAMPTQTSKPIILEARTLKQFPVRGFPDGLIIYQTAFSLKLLLDPESGLNWKVHRWDPTKIGTSGKSESISSDRESSQGYQRKTEMVRARKFGNFTKNENNCLSSYYFSIRKGEIDSGKVKIENQGKQITIHPNCEIFCVDGAHRAKGLKDTLDDFRDEDGKWNNKFTGYEIPVLMTIGLTKIQEAEYFVIMNDEQRKVRTDLGHRLLAERPESTGTLMRKGVDLYKKAAKVRAAYAIIMSMSKKGVFLDRILPPNASKSDDDFKNATISERSFEYSLDPLLAKHGTLTPLSLDVQIRTLERYWCAIKDIVKDPFVVYNEETGDNPNKYCIQQPIGVVSLHMLLQDLALQCQKPPEKFSKEDFQKLLDVPCIRKIENWERPYGKWTRYGTNMKGYTRIAEDILTAIKKDNAKTWNELMRK